MQGFTELSATGGKSESSHTAEAKKRQIRKPKDFVKVESTLTKGKEEDERRRKR